MKRASLTALLMTCGLALFVSDASADITETSGAFNVVFPQGTLTEGAVEDDSTALVMNEEPATPSQPNYRELAAPLAVDINAPGTYIDPATLPGGQIPAGTRIKSYLVHIDPIDGPAAKCYVGTLRFDSPILGVMTQTSTLAAADPVLKASPGTVFETDASRGLELNPTFGSEAVIWEPVAAENGNPAERIRAGTCSAVPVDEFRVITAWAPDCDGRVTTVSDRARNSNGTVAGTTGDDVIAALAGDDTINAGGGTDLACGAVGNDTVSGDDGNDRLLGEVGDDHVAGGIGDDSVDGGEGDDSVDGGEGNDTALGGVGNDTLADSGGVNTLDGGLGNDTVNSGAGNDAVLGGDGDDTLADAAGTNTLDAGIGNDVITGGAGKDTALGGDGTDTLTGGKGKDKLKSGTGNDQIKSAGGGKDKVNCGAGRKDKATVDAKDKVKKNCEKVKVKGKK
jgi:hypothetical protein